MGRIYDCGAKHKQEAWQGSIRAELEVHNRRAWEVCARLLDKMVEPSQRAAFVLHWLRARIGSGKHVSILDDLLHHATATDRAVILTQLPRSETTCQRSLAYARVQWRKTAQRLVQLGYGDQLLDALGLSITAQGGLVVSDSEVTAVGGTH